MNILVLISGVLALTTASIHLFAGGKTVARPLLDSNIDPIVKLTVYACWHFVSIFLGASALVLLMHATNLAGSDILVGFISSMWLLFGFLFLSISLILDKPAGLLRLPQWTLLLPVGTLGLLGIALQN